MIESPRWARRRWALVERGTQSLVTAGERRAMASGLGRSPGRSGAEDGGEEGEDEVGTAESEATPLITPSRTMPSTNWRTDESASRSG